MTIACLSATIERLRPSDQTHMGGRVSSLADRDAPTAAGPRLREPAEIHLVFAFDSEACIRDKAGNVSGQEKSFEHPVMDWLPPLLPRSHASVIRTRVLEKQQRTTGPQHAYETAENIVDSLNGAERK